MLHNMVDQDQAQGIKNVLNLPKSNLIFLISYPSGTQRRIGRPGNVSGVAAPPCGAGG